MNHITSKKMKWINRRRPFDLDLYFQCVRLASNRTAEWASSLSCHWLHKGT